MKKELFISVVSPVYQAEKIISELILRVEKELSKITSKYEIILIEDCSNDKSWEEIIKIASTNDKVKAVKFSRNFGQHAAIKAGLEMAKGDCCIVIDCDLQDDPKYINSLVEEWLKGNDIVFTLKENRAHSIFKNLSTRFFNLIFNFLVQNKSIESSNNIGSFSLISRKVIEAFKQYNDYQFHYLMVLRWLGFKKSYVEVSHNIRLEGKSSYNLKKLLSHALVAIIYQSDKLLRLSIYMGFSFSILSIIGILIVISQYFLIGFKSGWASLFVLILLSTGLILIAVGVLGLYLGKLFEQVKNRPHFIIDKSVNL
ncbi:glycosyltransferase family 2 protein [Bacteroidota bacterium]|nr:glycosyltransferase family 2 protein [Bacteroidota bacterium]